MLNPITIKIAIIFLFLPYYLLAAAHLIYFQKLRLDLIKRRCVMLFCAVGFFFFFHCWKWLYVPFFCFSNKAEKPAERQIQSNGSWKLGGGRLHASSPGIKAPCLAAAGFISVTVTWVWSYFSPPHRPHFCECTVSLPLLSHANTVYWQFACLSSFSLLSYLLCTAGNSKVVLTSPSYRCSHW